MEIFLDTELEKFVSEKVASGEYESPSDVIQSALYLLEDRNLLNQAKLARLRKDIQIGIDQIERGEFVEFEENSLRKLTEEIKAKARPRQSERKNRRAA